MRKVYSVLLIIALSLSSCISIIDDPLVVVVPTVDFQAHVRKDVVYVNVGIYSNPTFVNAGNIPTIIDFTGVVEVYDDDSGELLGTTTVEGEGLNTIIEVTTTSKSYDDILVIARGEIFAYADEEADGLTDDDVLIHSSEYYETESLVNMISFEEYPIVDMNPVANVVSYVEDGKYNYIVSVAANPDYINTISIPLIFSYEGEVRVLDQGTGALLGYTVISGKGLSVSIKDEIVSGLSGVSNMAYVFNLTITCSGDVEMDGDPSNDIEISTIDFTDIIEVSRD